MLPTQGWIHTLLEEAENERMHLMTFLELKKPGPLFRLAVLGAQGALWLLGDVQVQRGALVWCVAAPASQGYSSMRISWRTSCLPRPAIGLWGIWRRSE